MKAQYILIIAASVLLLASTNKASASERELPNYAQYIYHYGVSPAITLAAFLARAGWFAARTAAQRTLDTGKFIYNNPVAACLVVPTNLFIAYALYKEGQAQYQQSKRDVSEFIRQFKAWQEEERLRKQYEEIL